MRNGRPFWVELIREFEAGEESQGEFTRRRRLPLATFRHWLYRIRREQAGSPPLLPVRVVSSTAPTARRQRTAPAVIEAEFASGTRLRFPAGIDVDYVAELLKRLG